jgi:RNA polymerase sigma-70 factor (ECF subfamily)
MSSPSPPLRLLSSALPPGPEPVAGAETARAPARLDLDAIFRQRARMVASIAFKILGRSHEVEDIVQEVFLDACQDQDRIRNPQAIATWLGVCTVRRARRRLRVRKLRQLFSLDAMGPEPAIADNRLSPAQHALFREVYAKLDRLPVEERLAWTLRYLQEEDLETVATLCGCSLATVKRRIASAARKLQEAVG